MLLIYTLLAFFASAAGRPDAAAQKFFQKMLTFGLNCV